MGRPLVAFLLRAGGDDDIIGILRLERNCAGADSDAATNRRSFAPNLTRLSKRTNKLFKNMLVRVACSLVASFANCSAPL